MTVPLRRRQPKIRTDDDSIGLIRRLAVHYPNTVIAGILNRQHRTTARGMSFTASRVASLRTHWHIPCHQPARRRRTTQRDRRRPPAQHRAVHPAALAE